MSIKGTRKVDIHLCLLINVHWLRSQLDVIFLIRYDKFPDSQPFLLLALILLRLQTFSLLLTNIIVINILTIKNIDLVRVHHLHWVLVLKEQLEVLLVAVNLLDNLFQVQMLLLEDMQGLLKPVLRSFPLYLLEAVE